MKVIEGVASEDQKRKKKYSDFNVYTASVRIEFLYSLELLPEKIYNLINELRIKRNNLIHAGIHVNDKDAELIYDATKAILLLVSGEEPLFNNPGWVRSGGWVSAK
ncbi:MAG: hypothetical protein OCC49_01060 [Fibrobacterales bacterium]